MGNGINNFNNLHEDWSAMKCSNCRNDIFNKKCCCEYYIGPTGPQGERGLHGCRGCPGAQGIQGEIGPQGIPGETGPQGIPGETGSQGTPGKTGSQGIPGETGSQGIPGETGPQGIPGETGPQGIPGETGPQGIQGEIGPQGIQGETGLMGPQGSTGPIGPAFSTAYGSFAGHDQGPFSGSGSITQGTIIPVRIYVENPSGTFTLNTDGSVTVNQAGLYLIIARIQVDWGYDGSFALQVNAGLIDTTSVINGGSAAMTAIYRLEAGSRVYNGMLGEGTIRLMDAVEGVLTPTSVIIFAKIA